MNFLPERTVEFFKKFATREIYIAAVIILIGGASFGLGRLSVLYEIRPEVTIESIEDTGDTMLQVSAESAISSQSAAAIQATAVETSDGFETVGGEVVGSKNGTIYHFPWCSGAKRISEANKIWFLGPKEARAAGYEPAANCKGLQ